MPAVDLGDVTIHYEEAGRGKRPALILCHGLGGSSANFAQDLEFWSQYAHVIAWDNRGLGRSSRAEKYSVPLYASDLARLMDALDVPKAIVYGVSWGGVLVQQFALDYPHKCAAIILDSTSSEVNVKASENWYQRGEVARLGAAAAVTATEPAFAGQTNLASGMGDDAAAVRPEHIDSYVAQSRAVAGLREHPFTRRLGEIACPALVVGGGQDGTAGAGGCVILARNLPHSRLQIFQDAGHGIYRHQRDEFRALVLDFLGTEGLLDS
jgi:pimeloyl-ACP methyl ester carboxylesterase